MNSSARTICVCAARSVTLAAAILATFWIVRLAAGGPTGEILNQPASQPARRPPMTPPKPDDDEEKPPSSSLRKLTEQEIWRIRFLELRGMRQGTNVQPEPTTVKLDNKLVDEFLTLMQGDAAFLDLMSKGDKSYTFEQARADFRKLTAAQKVHVIAAQRGREFADRIHISSDPEVFVEFRKRVMPLILRGCATVGCHGPTGSEDVKFHLYRDPKKSADSTYANFIILNDLKVGDVPIINRSQPANSLLLAYMLPNKDVKPEQRHPGQADFKPLFQNRAAADFKRIENWISSLKHPAEDYGVHLLGQARPGEPGKEPGGVVPP